MLYSKYSVQYFRICSVFSPGNSKDSYVQPHFKSIYFLIVAYVKANAFNPYFVDFITCWIMKFKDTPLNLYILNIEAFNIEILVFCFFTNYLIF